MSALASGRQLRRQAATSNGVAKGAPPPPPPRTSTPAKEKKKSEHFQAWSSIDTFDENHVIKQSKLMRAVDSITGRKGLARGRSSSLLLSLFQQEKLTVDGIFPGSMKLKAEHIERCKLVEGTHEGGEFRPSRATNVPGNNANAIS